MTEEIFQERLVRFAQKGKSRHGPQSFVGVTGDLRHHPIGEFDPMVFIKDQNPIIS
jgi:hypothetical protein